MLLAIREDTIKVVTYEYAHVPGRISLCARCERSEKVRDTLPTIGQVYHGQHEGRCDVCRPMLA